MPLRAHVRKSSCPSPLRSPRSSNAGILLTGESSSGPRDTPSASVAKRIFRRRPRIPARQVGAALVGPEGPGEMEQEGVVDRVAALRLDPDDRRVRGLMLPVVEGPRIVHLEVEVHRPDLLRLQAELEDRLLVRLESLDRLEP